MLLVSPTKTTALTSSPPSSLPACHIHLQPLTSAGTPSRRKRECDATYEAILKHHLVFIMGGGHSKCSKHMYNFAIMGKKSHFMFAHSFQGTQLKQHIVISFQTFPAFRDGRDYRKDINYISAHCDGPAAPYTGRVRINRENPLAIFLCNFSSLTGGGSAAGTPRKIENHKSQKAIATTMTSSSS